MRKCACCGSVLQDENDPFEMCDVCDWQRDDVIEDEPTSTGGANGQISLEMARDYWNQNHKSILNLLTERN